MSALLYKIAYLLRMIVSHTEIQNKKSSNQYYDDKIQTLPTWVMRFEFQNGQEILD